MDQEFKYNFLIDKPLETSEDVNKSKFGHEEIAETLANIVAKCPTPFTIGLFGRWGSGKSTIANFLKNLLRKQEVPVVIFDVWKHEGDALRRTFLKEATNQLRSYGNDYFPEDFVLNERIENSISKTSEGKFKINQEKLKQLGTVLLIGVLILVVSGAIGYFLGFWEQFLYLISILFAIGAGGSFLLWLIKNAGQFLITETTTYGQDRFVDPHQFEAEFARILKDLKNRKVVIIFDNLDRVTHDKSVEVLSTIKTFLEPEDIKSEEKDVIFLIPCDAGAIRQHIAGVYNVNTDKESPFSPDEFLRKFFNSILWIPEFIPEELEAYARSKLKETEVDDLDNDRVAWVITKALRDNPRQVVQFINILLSNYLLIKEREGEGKDFPPEFLKENIPQLTKYLILSELFPVEIEELRKQKVLNLQEVNNDHLKTKGAGAFLSFIKETELDIPITSLRIFFTLRRSEHEKKFPGIESFIAFLEDRKKEEAQKYFVQLKDMDKREVLNAFSQVVKTELENKTNPVSIAAFIDTLIFVLDKNKIKMEATAYGEIYGKLASSVKSHLHTIEPQPLSRQLLEPYPQYRNDIVKQWVEILRNQTEEKPAYKIDEQLITDLIRIFSEQPDYLENGDKEALKEILVKERFSHDLSISKALAENKELQKRLVTPAFVSNFVKGIELGSDEEEVLARIELLNSFEPDMVNFEVSNEILQKLADIQTEENKNTTDDRIQHKAKLVKSYIKLLSGQPDILSSATEALLDVFADSLITASNAITELPKRKVFVPLLLKIRDFVSDPKASQIQSTVTDFLTSAEMQDVDYVVKDTSDEKAFIEGSDYSSVFEKRALTNQDFFDYIYDKLSNEKKSEFLDKLFNTDHNKALQKIENLSYKIHNAKSVVEKAFSKIDSLGASDKAKFLKLANNLKCANDAGLRETLSAKLKTYLTSTDLSLQEVGFNGFSDAISHIGEARTRQLIKDVFDWVRSPEVANKYQPFAIRGSYLGYKDQLNEEEQKEFQQFIFEELIRKGVNQEALELGFSLLEGIDPKYEDRRRNFDDIKERIESEENEAIKKALIAGLKKLRPARPNKHNKNYWEWVDLLSL
jgi:hypothetical protein